MFVNDTSTIAAGKGRVTVRHVAAAPAVKVTADGATLIKSLSNPNEATAVVGAKTYSVAVSPASGGASVFSGDVPVAAGADTIVYAYGSLSDDTFAVATQSINDLGGAPSSVAAGGGALAGGRPASRCGPRSRWCSPASSHSVRPAGWSARAGRADRSTSLRRRTRPDRAARRWGPATRGRRNSPWDVTERGMRSPYARPWW